jgi:hypothetical protein
VHVENKKNICLILLNLISVFEGEAIKMHLKDMSTLFCGQNLEPDVHLFENGGSSRLG